MFRSLITTFALALALALPATAMAKDYTVSKAAGDYTVEAAIDKNPPVTGKNNIAVKVKDKAGNYVADAKVVVDYSMPAMPGMPAMNYKSDAPYSGDSYKAVMDLSMAGPWNITVKVTHSGKTSSIKFNVDAR